MAWGRGGGAKGGGIGSHLSEGLKGGKPKFSAPDSAERPATSVSSGGLLWPALSPAICHPTVTGA